MSEKADSKRAGSPRILAVDDEPRNLELLARALRRLGTVETAESGDEASGRIRETAYDLVISDQRMPGLKGAELLEQVAEQDERIGRVLITGYADMQATVDAINRGRVHAYVSKPWKPDQLAVLVKSLLERTQLARSNDALVKDLSARNEELEIAMAELQRSNQQVSEGLDAGGAGVSLGTLLQPLRRHVAKLAEDTAKLAERSGLTDAERLEFADSAHDVADQLRRACDDLLELSRATDPTARVDADIQSLVREAVEAARPGAGSRGVEVELEQAGEARARLDAPRVVRALTGVVRNAVEASAPGSRVQVHSGVEDGAATIRVGDSGSGIPAALRVDVLRPLVAYAKPGHLGMGLAFADKVVKEHQGEIRIEDASPSGTVFEIRLPLAVAQQP